jgi:hypothetical protein
MSRGGGKWALLLLMLIFLVPSTFQFEPPAIPIGDFYVTVVEVCIGGLVLIWVATSLMRRPPSRAPFTGGIVALLVVLAISVAAGVRQYGPVKALGDARQYVALCLYFWAIRDLSTGERLANVREWLVGVLGIVAAYVVAVFAFFRGELAGYAALRGASTVMEDRVFFDNTLFLLLVYAGYLLNKALVSRQRRYWYLGVLASNAAMLLVMQVRTYWVAFAIVVLAVCWAERRSLVRARVIAPMAFMLLLLVAGGIAASLVDEDVWGGAGTSIAERVTSLVHFRETFFENSVKTTTEVETLSTRRATAEVVWREYVIPNIVFGVAMGGELPMVNAYGSVEVMKYQIDNGYLTILAKFGMVGLGVAGFVIWQVMQCLRRVLRSVMATEEERMLARSMLSGIVAVLVASGFSSVFVRQQPSLVAFTLVLAETVVLVRNVRVRKALLAGPHAGVMREVS